LFNANSAIVQLYHGENKLILNEMMISIGTIPMKWRLHSTSIDWFCSHSVFTCVSAMGRESVGT